MHGVSVKRDSPVYETDLPLRVYEHTDVGMAATSTEKSIPKVHNSTRKVGVGVETPVLVS